jgi:glycosyltransferase involved in cell wall biosynthesis
MNHSDERVAGADEGGFRVLQLVRAFDVGGLERVVIDLLKGLAAKDVSCHVGCLSHAGAQIDLACKDGLWVGNLGVRGRLRTLLNLCLYVRRNRIDVIHSHNPTPHLFAAMAGLLTCTPVVHTKHGRNYPDNPRWVRQSRLLSRFTRYVAAVSQDAADVALDVERVPARKVQVLQNGIDVDAYGEGKEKAETGKLSRPMGDGLPGGQQRSCNAEMGRGRLREEFGVSEDAFVIGSVGRFSPEKCYPMLVEAFGLFCAGAEEGGRPHLVLVGDGADRVNIEMATRRLGLMEHVTLTGMSNQVADWLRTMDIFTLSSRTEGTSITLLEAAATGLPLVVTDVGGNREIVDGGNAGVLVPPGDPKVLADAFLELARDESLRRELGAKARKRVWDRYSVGAMVDGYVQIYREVLGMEPQIHADRR